MAAGHGLQRHGQRLDDEIVERELEGARAVLRRHGVQPRAGGEQRVELAVDRQIEMRDGLLRQREPFGDEAAHGVVRHDVIRPGIVEREHLAVGESARRLRRLLPDQLVAASLGRVFDRVRLGVHRLDRLGRTQGLARGKLDVGFDDAAMRARAVERCKVEPELAREPAGERRSKDAARVTVPVVPSDLRGDLAQHLLGFSLSPLGRRLG